MSANFVGGLQQIAVNAVEAGKPVHVVYGTVTSANPLEIITDQKTPLKAANLILTRNVTDYSVPVTFNHATESAAGGSGESSFAAHIHQVSGKKTITVHNGLIDGEKVILLRVQGGQKFVVWDRLI